MTALGMPVKDFSESATSLLMFIYKVENEKVLTTTALAMSSGASKSKDKTLSSLEPFQQFFTEEKTSSLLSLDLLGQAEDLNVEANAALQALLLLSAMNICGKQVPCSSIRVPARKSLNQKSNSFKDKKLSAQLAKVYKDLNKMVSDF